jgi:hypothetical protein
MLLHVIASAMLLTAASAGASEPGYDLSGAMPIRLGHGVNSISNFDDAGHPAQIIYAWRENMNAHGYGIYSVLMPRPGTRKDWTLVTFETHEPDANQGSEDEALYDSPFDDEQAIASVRFVRMRGTGKAATLAVTARRDLSNVKSFADAAPVKFSIFKLVANEGAMQGWRHYYFDRVEHFTSDKPYCNSDMALTQVLHLPLPKDYRGLRNEDGCIR